MKIYKRRGITIILDNKCDQFKKIVEEREKYRACCQEIFNKIRQLMISGQLEKRLYGSFCDICIVQDSQAYYDNINDIVSKDDIQYGNFQGVLNTVTTAKLVKGMFGETFEKYGFAEKGISNYKRSIVKHALDRIDGFLTRNKKSKKVKKNGGLPHVNFQGKVIHIAEGLNYNQEEKTLTIPYSGGKLTVPVYDYIGKGMVKKNFGGNFIFKYDKNKNIYAIVVKAAIEIFSEPMYEPVGFIGFDINETPTDWIVYSDGTKTMRPPEMSVKIKENRTLNYEISNTNKKAEITLQDGTVTVLRSRERRKRRLKQREVLKAIQRMTRPFAEEVINKAIQSRMGIAIDKINPGASGGGEFGQYISEYIISMCEDKNIPFYVCPSAYTSRRCVCGNEDKKNRKGDIFKCVECGYEANSHVHAAQNMVRIAEELYDNETMYFGSKSKSINQLMRTSNDLWKRYNGEPLKRPEEEELED